MKFKAVMNGKLYSLNLYLYTVIVCRAGWLASCFANSAAIRSDFCDIFAYLYMSAICRQFACSSSSLKWGAYYSKLFVTINISKFDKIMPYLRQFPTDFGTNCTKCAASVCACRYFRFTADGSDTGRWTRTTLLYRQSPGHHSGDHD